MIHFSNSKTRRTDFVRSTCQVCIRTSDQQASREYSDAVVELHAPRPFNISALWNHD